MAFVTGGPSAPPNDADVASVMGVRLESVTGRRAGEHEIREMRGSAPLDTIAGRLLTGGRLGERQTSTRHTTAHHCP
jgi:hypothetical protein